MGEINQAVVHGALSRFPPKDVLIEIKKRVLAFTHLIP